MKHKPSSRSCQQAGLHAYALRLDQVELHFAAAHLQVDEGLQRGILIGKAQHILLLVEQCLFAPNYVSNQYEKNPFVTVSIHEVEQRRCVFH